MTKCPYCMCLLDHAVERPIIQDRPWVAVQMFGATFVAEKEAAKVMGECPKHGVVTTVRKVRK